MSLRKRYKSQKEIGIFVCGPPVISNILLKNCNKFSKDGTVFKFNKENF